MSVINKLVVDCSGTETEFVINLPVEDEAGINAMLDTVPSAYGTYVYSYTVSGNTSNSSLSANDLNGCVATLYKDGIGYKSESNYCINLDPSELISSDLLNLLSIGSDNKLWIGNLGIADIDGLGDDLDGKLNLSGGSMTGQILFKNSTPEIGGFIGLEADNDLTVKGTNYLRLKGGQYVGIHTGFSSTPNFMVSVNGNTLVNTVTDNLIDKLQVNGSISATSLKLSGLTTNYLPKIGANGLLSNSQIFDNGTNVGIGITTPNAKVDTRDGHYLSSRSTNLSQTNILLQGAGYHIGSTLYGNVSIRSSYNHISNSGSLEFYVAPDATNTNEAMRITRLSNLLLGTTTDNLIDRLQVNGSGSFTGSLKSFDTHTIQSLTSSDDATLALFQSGSNYWFFRNKAPFGQLHFIRGTSIYGRINESGQWVIGNADVSDSAQLDVQSTTKGFLPPRMTQAQRAGIVSPAEGLLVYQTDGTKGWYGYDGAAWVILN